MNIFIIGLPGSGRTTLAKRVVSEGFIYIDASDWLKNSFRAKLPEEHEHQYQDALHAYITKNLYSAGEYTITQHVLGKQERMKKSEGLQSTFVIDGVFLPQDFSNLFNPKKDMVIFLNCTNNTTEYKDYQTVGVSVIRDCCFCLSAAGLLSGERWLEYNFCIPGTESDAVKKLSHKNTVFITKSLDKTISHVIEYISLLNL